ncbi:MAG: tetratricopeptide repeat protein [Kordia sp.]|uniref:tetratricopeptide repeat protein n=1 Tax=Kordia sp. TaxID=1965332 RepID=UPI00385E9E78
MKKTITLLVAGLFAVTSFTTLNAQDCKTKLSLFAENAKAKNYAEAETQLNELRTDCPSVSSAIYAYGERIYKAKLKKATDKKAVAEELIKLYRDRIANVPAKTKKGDVLGDIGTLMVDYKIGDVKSQYDVFDEAFKTDLVNFKNPKSLYQYFELYYSMYQTGDSGVLLENLIQKFEELTEKFESESERLAKTKNELIAKKESGQELTSKEKRKEKVADTNIKAIAIFSGNMEALIEKVSTCETLIPLFRKNFDANRSNSLWLKRAAGRLDAKGCDEDPLFVELVEAVDALEPSANSKRYLAGIYERKGNLTRAEEYLNQSLDMEKDPIKKARLLYKIASKAKKRGQKSKARKYYLDAVKNNPSLGGAYLKIAQLYASSVNQCGKDEFTKRAGYWKAAEMARKAGQVDPSLKSIANRTVDSYMKSAPSKADVFSRGLKSGASIPLNCWIGGSVRIPNL